MAGMFPTPIYPGIDVNANLGPYINTVCGVTIGLSLVTICLRFFSRWWTKIELGIDDYLIIVGAAFSWTFSIMCIVQVQENFYGQHVSAADLEHVKEFLKACYIIIILYLPAITSSKLSLLALYWRAFAESRGKLPIMIAAGANVLWMVVVSFLAAFSCNPVRGFWDITTKSKCLNINNLFIATEAFTIALDIIVLVMPVYFIKSIKRSLSQRISISSTFLIGLVVTIISCIRLWRLVRISHRPGFDPTFNQIDAGVWGSLELNIWVIVASIPALRPLFTTIWRNSHGTTGYSRTYVNEDSRGIKARYGSRKTNTAISLESRDGTTFEDNSTLVSARPQASTISDHRTSGATDVERGIRVDQEVNVSVRDKPWQRR
ncbi:hypothetical protein B0O99DRAFT_684044 [Bisporella sp. PMI_857]|nr:hypothetical protein B0O99DRAFT_684044 [Bisporella sp. PMI_857]